MDEEDIEIFIKNLSLKLCVYSFDTLVANPGSFSALGEINTISDTAPCIGYGKLLVDFLKPFKEKKMLKRKLSNCSDTEAQERILKNKKSDVHETEVTDTEDLHSEQETAGASCMGDHSAKQKNFQEEKTEDETDKIDFSNTGIKKAIEHLNRFLTDTNLNALREVIKKSRDEGELEVGLGIHLISKLAGKAYTSKQKSFRSCPCGCKEKLPDNETMWIGTKDTWYGELDILAGNPAKGDSVSVTVKNYDGNQEIETQKAYKDSDDEEENQYKESTEEKGESPGDQTNMEMEFSGLIQALNQVSTQAVVFAFTEFNRHKTMGHCIPSIYIDRSTFQYVIYSPVEDVLLVSNHMVYTYPKDFDKETGYRPFIVLWIILNHRLFFRKCPDFRKRFTKSGFHQKIQNLEAYQNLTQYSNVLSVERNYSFENDTPNTIRPPAMEWFLDKCD
ncbi:uncharacterized protein LOC132726733 [Ruditapes philippinarum]|uniref:uncharacterized protein LOC132726733 n=1 Tax=Ruditapes philippinarum TaxID=129788 RepID=UPI00295BE2C6|nr:uncharacterized protein LOC132726733 [Ruditapes philippinarum]